MRRGEVRAVGAAAHDEVGIGVAGGPHDCRRAFAGERWKPVWFGGGANGVDRDAQVAIGAVFEADRHGQAGGEFAVHLAFDRARADGSPADRVGVVLAESRVEKLGRDRQTFLHNINQELTGESQAAIDLVGTIETGVVDEPFPADNGAGFLKIDPHDDEQVVGETTRRLAQIVGVVEGGRGIVNGAGPHDRDESIGLPPHDCGNFPSGGGDSVRAGGVQRNILGQHPGGDQGLGVTNAKVGSLRHRATEAWEAGRGWQGALARRAYRLRRRRDLRGCSSPLGQRNSGGYCSRWIRHALKPMASNMEPATAPITINVSFNSMDQLVCVRGDGQLDTLLGAAEC